MFERMVAKIFSNLHGVNQTTFYVKHNYLNVFLSLLEKFCVFLWVIEMCETMFSPSRCYSWRCLVKPNYLEPKSLERTFWLYLLNYVGVHRPLKLVVTVHRWWNVYYKFNINKLIRNINDNYFTDRQWLLKVLR